MKNIIILIKINLQLLAIGLYLLFLKYYDVIYIISSLLFKLILYTGLLCFILTIYELIHIL